MRRVGHTGSYDGRDEELRTVGVRSSVGHGQQSRLGVAELEVLVLELLAVDGLATGTVTAGEVTTLEHELGNHTVIDMLECEVLMS